MILDITLKGNRYLLTVHKKFFDNKSFPLHNFRNKEWAVMKKYESYGSFEVNFGALGFGNCFDKQSEDNDYVYYSFKLDPTDRREIRKMMLTLYLLSEYVVEQMHYYKELFSDGIWDDQSLSFVIFDGGSVQNGYPIAGKIYPWFYRKLDLLSREQVASLNEYVLQELTRIKKEIYNEDLSYSQVSIETNSFHIQVNMGGRWISWKHSTSARDVQKTEFHSHNIDHSSDQEMCFAAVVLINTWLRNNL